MLNIDAVLNAKMFDFPFKWGVADGLLPLDQCGMQMCDDFPIDSFRYRRYLNGRYMRRLLVPLGDSAAFRAEELSGSFNELAADLTGAPYRDALSRATGIDLQNSPMEAAIWRADASTKYALHDDDPNKLLTHVIYFNHDWKKRDGGALQILASQVEDDVVVEVVPRLGMSVLICRSENSWHNITQISDTAQDTRNTITVHFYRPGTTLADLPAR